MDVTIVSQSYSATNWQKEVCHFQNGLKSPLYITWFAKTAKRNLEGTQSLTLLGARQVIMSAWLKPELYW